MTRSIQLTDALLAEALSRRAAHAPRPVLLETIITGVAATPQDRATRRWTDGFLEHRRTTRFGVQAVAAGAAVLVAAAVLFSAVNPPLRPGASPTPSPVEPSSSPNAVRTPEPLTLGQSSALRLRLGSDVGPIDVISAFGSIWTANIGAGDVRRFDPLTLAELARIPVPGAAWFLVADNALWVTGQGATGISRIDPATNRVVGHVGDVAPCGAPALAVDGIWLSACDADVYLRIDPSTTDITATIPAQGHGWVVSAGARLVTLGPDALATLDPETGAFTPIPGTPGSGSTLMGSDGANVWVQALSEIHRIDSGTGSVRASFAYASQAAVTFANGRAWLATTTEGVIEIDLATNDVVEVIPVPPSPVVARWADGRIWVTDLEASTLWRIDP